MDTLVLFALCLLSCHMPGYRPLYLFCRIALGPSPVQTTPFARVLSPCWNNGLFNTSNHGFAAGPSPRAYSPFSVNLDLQMHGLNLVITMDFSRPRAVAHSWVCRLSKFEASSTMN